MYIFRQNSYVAFLIGVILVGGGAICLMGADDPAPKSPPDSGIMQASMPLYLQGSLAAEPSAVLERPQNGQVVRRGIPPMPHLITLELKGAAVNAVEPSEMLEEMNKEKIILQKNKIKSLQNGVKPEPAAPPDQLFFTRTELLSHSDQEKALWSYALSDEDLKLLHKIVMAEAEGEPYEGKVAVTNVILNRLRSANFPDTIKEVIYQKSQFSPVHNGRMKKVKPNEETIKAVTEALNGRKEVPDDTYYFLSLTLASDLTVAKTKDEIKTIGNHTFYK